MQRGGDSADLDLERRRDLPVAQVGVVAKEDHEALPLGKCCEVSAQLWVGLGDCAAVIDNSDLMAAPSLPGAVDDAPPDPAFESAAAGPLPSVAQGVREPFLHRLERSLTRLR